MAAECGLSACTNSEATLSLTVREGALGVEGIIACVVMIILMMCSSVALSEQNICAEGDGLPHAPRGVFCFVVAKLCPIFGARLA